MNGIMHFLKRYPVISFCTLTVLLSYASYFLPIPREGLPFAFVVIPTVVALALAAATEGRAGLRALLGQVARMGDAKWILGAIALGLVMRLAVGLLAQVMGLIPAVPLLPQNAVQVIILALVFLVAALLEELGWRGYALTRLLRRRSALFAGLVLGVPWGIIHIALHLPGMWAQGLPWLPTVAQLVALSVIIAWLFVRSGQSLLVAIVFHAAQSAFGFLNEGLTPLHVTWLMTAVWSATALAAAIDLLTSARLKRQLTAAT